MLLTTCQSASSPEENPEAEFIDAIKDSGANLVGASALLNTTMLQQKKLIEGLEEAGLRDRKNDGWRRTGYRKLLQRNWCGWLC